MKYSVLDAIFILYIVCHFHTANKKKSYFGCKLHFAVQVFLTCNFYEYFNVPGIILF